MKVTINNKDVFLEKGTKLLFKDGKVGTLTGRAPWESTSGVIKFKVIIKGESLTKRLPDVVEVVEEKKSMEEIYDERHKKFKKFHENTKDLLQDIENLEKSYETDKEDGQSHIKDSSISKDYKKLYNTENVKDVITDTKKSSNIINDNIPNKDSEQKSLFGNDRRENKEYTKEEMKAQMDKWNEELKNSEEDVLDDFDEELIDEIELRDNEIASKERLNEEGEIKPRFSLIPQLALEEVAKVLTYGAQKYPDFNYSKSQDVTTYIDACHRHINKFLRNEDIDAETKTNHLANAIANLMITLDGILNETAIDDRNKHYGKN